MARVAVTSTTSFIHTSKCASERDRPRGQSRSIPVRLRIVVDTSDIDACTLLGRPVRPLLWLLVSLRVGPILARLGLGARPVALISAAHAGRVALIWPARVGCRWMGGSGSRGVCLGSK